MNNEKRLPWMKWYPAHWRGDVRLHRCSYAARGLWADMLSLMGGECDRQGYLVIEGQPCGANDLSLTFGGSTREVDRLLKELHTKRVFSKVGDDDLPDDIMEIVAADLPLGTIFSRRMIRDKAKADKDRSNGSLGGNPKLREGDNVELDLGVNPRDKAKREENRDQNPPIAPQEILDDEMRAWAATNAPLIKNLESEIESYRDWKRSKGRAHKDERAGFRNWLKKAQQFAAERLDRDGGTFSRQSGAASRPQLADPEAQQQRAAIEIYLKNGVWDRVSRDRYGEAPGLPGCRMRPALIGEYRARLDALRNPGLRAVS